MKQRTMWWLAAAAVAFLCTAGAGTEIYRDYRASRDAIMAQTEATARLADVHAERSLARIKETFDRLTPLILDMDRTSPEAMRDLRDRFQDMSIASESMGTIWLIDVDGWRLLNNVSIAGRGANASNRFYFQAARDAPDAYVVGPTETGTIVPRPRFTLSKAVVDEAGIFRGVLAAGVDVEHFSRLYDSVPMGPNVQLVAFNATGDLLTKSPNASNAVVDIARQHVQPQIASSTEHDQWIIAGQRLQSFPISLVAVTDFNQALERWRFRSWQVGLLSALMILGFIILTLAGIRSAEREVTAAETLRHLNETLEERVRERTQSLNLLLRELNHRVKNNLQIVGSLIRLQARTQKQPEITAMLERTNQRLFAIADLHSELEMAETGCASSRQFFDRIVRRILDVSEMPGRRIDLRLELDDVPLSVDRAVPLGLILNEIVTNSVKHAFEGRIRGAVEVRFRVADGIAELAVRDDGESARRTGRPDGLGSQIVAMLTRQIQGTCAVTDGGGRLVRIVAPLGAAAEEKLELARAAE